MLSAYLLPICSCLSNLRVKRYFCKISSLRTKIILLLNRIEKVSKLNSYLYLILIMLLLYSDTQTKDCTDKKDKKNKKDKDKSKKSLKRKGSFSSEGSSAANSRCPTPTVTPVEAGKNLCMFLA